MPRDACYIPRSGQKNNGRRGHPEFSQPTDLHRQFTGHCFHKYRGIMRDIYNESRMSVDSSLHSDGRFLNLKFWTHER